MIPQKGWYQWRGTEFRGKVGNGSKYLLGEDVWIGDDGRDEVLFLSLEEGFCDRHSADLEPEIILLKCPVFVESKEGLLNRDKVV